MQIGRHHFFENLFAATKANDRNLAKNILITELANQIIASPFTVREILAQNGVAVSKNATSEEIANLLIENFPKNKEIRTKITNLIFSCNRFSFDGLPHYGDDDKNKKVKWENITSEKNKIFISQILKEALLEEKAGKLSTEIIGLVKQVQNKSKLFAFNAAEEDENNKEKKPPQIGFFKMVFIISAATATLCGLFALWYRYVEKKTD